MATATTKTATKRPAKAAPKKEETSVLPMINGDAFKSAEDFTSAAREQMEEVVKRFNGAAEDFRDQTEDMVEEMRERFEKNQKVFTDLNQQVMDAARTEMSDAVQFASELGKAKTLADALEIQQSYFSNLFETRMARSQEMAEKSVEVAKESFSPVSTDFGAFFDSKAFEGMFKFPGKS